MKNPKKNISNLVSKILNEEINNKVNKLYEEYKEGEWTEIEVDEELHGKQKKLDVAKPKGKLTSADFKKLRQSKNKKREMDEMLTLGPDDEDFDDEDFEDEDFELSDEDIENRNFWHVPNVYEKLRQYYQKKYGTNDFDDVGGNPYRQDVDESDENGETEEGNAFTGALSKAKKEGKSSFEVDGKKYNVKEAKKSEKWIQKTDMKKGALHKKLGVEQGEKIPVSKLKSLKKELSKKAEGDKKLSPSDSKLLKQVNLALTLKSVKEQKSSLQLTEEELVNMIETIVTEQKTKENLSKKQPIGLKKTIKAQEASKKENDNYAKEVVKKMKEYVKHGSKGEYKESPESFPQNNYTINKMKDKTMKYHPSQAVEEYIEAFAFPGMTNLVYDEIKPDEKRIEKYLKGDSTTGNAVKDKNNKPLGNVVPSEVGERFMKNFEDNLYGAEQMNGSYKRQPQPVDVGGSEKMDGSLKSIRKGSTKKSNRIMNQLESQIKKENLISEEMSKMKNLIRYNRKTQ